MISYSYSKFCLYCMGITQTVGGKQLKLLEKTAMAAPQSRTPECDQFPPLKDHVELNHTCEHCVWTLRPTQGTASPHATSAASPELGHSCRALAMRVLAMFFSPARYSSLTDSNLRRRPRGGSSARRPPPAHHAHHLPTTRPHFWKLLGSYSGRSCDPANRAVRHQYSLCQAHQQLPLQWGPGTLTSLRCK